MSPGVEQLLQDYFREQPEVAAVYLFGSFAVGRGRPESDVDLAVLREPIRDRRKAYEIRVRYLTELSQLMKRDVDVVLLREAGETLSEEILRTGRVVYERDREERVAFAAKRILQCLDFHPIRSRQEKAVSAAIRRRAHGEAGGSL